MSAWPLIAPPTPNSEVNAVLLELMEGVRRALGPQLVAIYIYGSLTSGDFDRQSDIDVLVVTTGELSREVFSAVAALHERIAAGDSWCATQLEVAYVPMHALRRYDAATSVYPHLDRGTGERLTMKEHWSDCIVQRKQLRERGITVAGPHPSTLIDPVSADDLREAMHNLLPRWGESLFNDPAELRRRGSQSYLVLSICRMLYTLETGAFTSKRHAADWAKRALDKKWCSLIDRAWDGRQHPDAEASAEDASETMDLMRYAVAAARLNQLRASRTETPRSRRA
jgi:predicted nucleotidyltransferase